MFKKFKKHWNISVIIFLKICLGTISSEIGYVLIENFLGNEVY